MLLIIISRKFFADPHQFDPVSIPDPAFHYDPDPASQNDADPDPQHW